MAARGSHSATFMLAGLPERSSAERACDAEETYDEEPPTRRPSMVRASGFSNQLDEDAGEAVRDTYGEPKVLGPFLELHQTSLSTACCAAASF